ncbi:glycoside hydrolase family 99-like domain-containing protein [Frigidibacter sp. RF13]|uniref:glycoside hydrolase family 99-like domain-containing protein n=1 Tax=Frigidibacter sp. RF13 TaxID=2997340 RepID=UPI00226F2F96|nr:glycoside hydrolase family 99-like domain-containing protein [Frigidibacter sp. RF13]MCY1128042.1 glycoside hydrolase family 99-like domain-containing protein [Frigidibacter sp. RF13]
MAERFRRSLDKRDPKRREDFLAQPEMASEVLKRARSVTRTDIANVDFSAVREDFVPYAPPQKMSPRVKLIAFYLPQYHPFPENDEWWGKGFTEWTNVGKAVPNFVGHYQPHCPIHFGYYDLRVPQVMEDQARVLKEYGLHGFSYYFYWFGGKILMETPLKAMLDNPKADAPFCFTWANENWTRRWDGAEENVLIAQKHSIEDSLALLRHFAVYFADPRYIRVDDKPLFIVYRADIIPDLKNIVAAWREEAKRLGFKGLYIVGAQSFGVTDPRPYGFDAAVEFPPHGMASDSIRHEVEIVNPDYTGPIYNYEQIVDNAVTRPEPSYKLFRTAMLSWDNTARRQNASHIMARFSVTKYAQWLSALCHRAAANPKYSDDEKLVFINAWNEWAEGTHLEPDRKHGFGYLQATYDTVASLGPVGWNIQELPATRRHDTGVILHVHYEETWPELKTQLDRIGPHDLYVTTTSTAIAERIRADRPDAWVELVENRGRDIRPFLSVLRRIRPLGYRSICKLHSKKSAYRADGEALRQAIIDSLVSGNCPNLFAADPRLGLVAPKGSYIPHTDKSETYNGANVAALSQVLGFPFKRDRFPAGSMFWFRPEALEVLDKIDLDACWGVENGLADGTWAHAIERIFAVAAQHAGYHVIETTA